MEGSVHTGRVSEIIGIGGCEGRIAGICPGWMEGRAKGGNRYISVPVEQ